MEQYLKIVVVAYLLIVLVGIFNKRFKIGFHKEIFLYSVLSLAQLIGIGFVILFLLKLKSQILNVAFTIIFFTNASLISLKRFRIKGYPRFWVFFFTFISISFVSGLSLLLLHLYGILTL